MSEQWCIGFTRAEREKAKTALREHKKLIPAMKSHRINEKTIIQLPAGLTKKEVQKRINKYKSI